MPFNIFSFVILEADLIDIGHLDPLERHKGRSNLGHYGYINHRYSSFKVSRIPDIFCFEVLMCTDLIQLKKVYSVIKNDDKISLYRFNYPLRFREICIFVADNITLFT